jgi:hypothetical protein
VGNLLDGFGFHVAISDGGAWWCGADVVGPWGAKEEAARDCGHHGPGVDDSGGVVWGDSDFVGLSAGFVKLVGRARGGAWGWR